MHIIKNMSFSKGIHWRHLYTEVAFQKSDCLHNNPTAVHWQLVKDPCDYKYSTARYYERGEKDYSFIKDLREEF
jgi:hypothetical protein